MYCNNKSGVRGVFRYEHAPRKTEGVKTKYAFWKAGWMDSDGRARQKSFSCTKYGEDKAREMAIDYRNKMVAKVDKSQATIPQRRETWASKED